MNEITEIEVDTLEAGPSQGWKPYCKNTPREKMSASWLSSCKSRGLVTRDTDKTQKTDSGRKKHNFWARAQNTVAGATLARVQKQANADKSW